jgi:transcriptional regulator with XRE-family HTH domain
MNREAYDRARGSRLNQEIAATLRMDPSYLSRIVSGRVKPSIEVARRIADVLAVSLDELWPSRRDHPSPRPTGTDAPTKIVSISEAGRRGGHARAAVLSPSRRKAIAQAAARARWGESPQSSSGRWVAEACRQAAANDGQAYAVAA